MCVCVPGHHHTKVNLISSFAIWHCPCYIGGIIVVAIALLLLQSRTPTPATPLLMRSVTFMCSHCSAAILSFHSGCASANRLMLYDAEKRHGATVDAATEPGYGRKSERGV